MLLQTLSYLEGMLGYKYLNFIEISRRLQIVQGLKSQYRQLNSFGWGRGER